MKRKNGVQALIKRSEEVFKSLTSDYEKSLHNKSVSSELKIDIKNLCENLRSVLDYLAHDIRETHCPSANPSDRFYFPIFPDFANFNGQCSQWYPGLQSACLNLWNYLESIQSYHKKFEWLGQFNRLNNENKHDSLVEQEKTETKRVHVELQNGGSVSWNPSGVKFGSGVYIGGVLVNPESQMPIPHPSQEVKIINWVDFRFKGINVSAITLLKNSLDGISKIAEDICNLL